MSPPLDTAILFLPDLVKKVPLMFPASTKYCGKAFSWYSEVWIILFQPSVHCLLLVATT